MSRRDLSQKLEMRSAFWSMGASTRMEVKLGALVRRADNRADRQEWTDLDVLAVHYSPLLGLTLIVADCKTGRTRVAERLFWLRGVMDVVGARSGYLVRDSPLSQATRQLALRLGIAALDQVDREALTKEVVTVESTSSNVFGDADRLLRWEALLSSVPRDLERLTRYRDTGYWIAPSHRNITSLPAVVRASTERLYPEAPWAMALIADLGWLYLLACLRALDDMTRLQLANPTVGLAQIVVGDERERREKEFLADQLRRLFEALPKGGQSLPPVDIVPPYYGDLTDLMMTLLRRRYDALDALRVLELVSFESALPNGDHRIDLGDLRSNSYAIKLASDVIRFLVRAGGLRRQFAERFDAITTNTESGRPGDPGPGSAVPESDDHVEESHDADRPRDQISLFGSSHGSDGDRIEP